MVKAALPTPVRVGHNRVRTTRGANAAMTSRHGSLLAEETKIAEINCSTP